MIGRGVDEDPKKGIHLKHLYERENQEPRKKLEAKGPLAQRGKGISLDSTDEQAQVNFAGNMSLYGCH